MTKYWPILLSGMLASCALWFGYSSGGDDVESWRLASRYTARLAFLLFSLTFVTSSLYEFWPNTITRALMRQRRYWGLSFALAQTFFGYADIRGMMLWDDPPMRFYDFAQGGVAFLLIYALAFTSNNASQRAMGQKWNLLHLFGSHIIWMVFVAAYTSRLFREEQRLLGAVMLIIAFGTFGLRIASARKQTIAYRAKLAAES